MKKYLFFAAALVALASCSSDSLVGENNNSPDLNPVSASGEKAIVFNSGANAITRADYTGADAATKLGENFVVFGFKGDGTTKTTVFDHYNVNWGNNTAHTTTSNTANWEYVAQEKHGLASTAAQTIKYWDYATTQYDFIAWSKGSATAVYANSAYDVEANVLITATTPATMTSSTGGAYTIKGKAENLAKVYIADLVTAYRDKDAERDALGDYQKEVDITFRSLSAKVRIALYEIIPGYSVKDVKFYSDATSNLLDETDPTDGAANATANKTAKLFTTGDDVFNEVGTYTVYFPTTGSGNTTDKDYNKAHLAFTAEASGTTSLKNFGALDEDTYVAKEVAETGADTKLYIGRSSNNATYAGSAANHHYTTVIPNETGAVLNLKVDYTLLSTDGSGETITVHSATAKVPAAYASWKSGYAYTYLFKISKNTNGLTNPDIDVEGLYPITFDAVVTETEDHVQETITTVAEPSITTYSKGAVVTSHDEYVTGQNIYAVVYDGTSNATLTGKVELYTVTLTAGAGAAEGSKPAQTINESSVDNALANSTLTAGVYKVTDINKWDLTLTPQAPPSVTDKIVDADSPTGKEIVIGTNQVAYFNPASAGTYVFRYVKVAHVEYQAPTYYTAEDEEVIAGTKEVGDEKTPEVAEVPGEYYYKIIKVVAAP